MIFRLIKNEKSLSRSFLKFFCNKKGYTLIEVSMAILIFSIFMLFISKSYFIALRIEGKQKFLDEATRLADEGMVIAFGGKLKMGLITETVNIYKRTIEIKNIKNGLKIIKVLVTWIEPETGKEKDFAVETVL